MRRILNKRADLVFGLIFVFLLNSLGLLQLAEAEPFTLPAPGAMLVLSPKFNPLILKGLKVHPDNPFRLDFILDVGGASKSSLQKESIRLIKYFLASLTIPEDDLWVTY